MTTNIKKTVMEYYTKSIWVHVAGQEISFLPAVMFIVRTCTLRTFHVLDLRLDLKLLFKTHWQR